MTEHDQRGCLRCGKPAGERCLCEACYSLLATDAGAAVCSAAPVAREARLERGAGAGGSGDARPADAATAPLRGGAAEASQPSALPEERRNPPSREVARLEDVLTPKYIDPELAACLKADAAGDPQGATNLGVLLEERGDLQGALAAYRRASRRGDVNGSFNLGCLLAEMGDLPGAQAALRLADEAGDGAAASNLGVLLEEQGDLDGAVAAYRRADERGDAAAAFNLGLLLAGRGDLPAARAAYQHAAERDDPEVRERALQALAEMGPDRVEPEPTAEPEPAAEPEPEPAPIPERRARATGPRARWLVALCLLALVAIVVARRRRRPC